VGVQEDSRGSSEHPQSNCKPALQQQDYGGFFFSAPQCSRYPSWHDCGVSICSLFSGTWMGSAELGTALSMIACVADSLFAKSHMPSPAWDRATLAWGSLFETSEVALQSLKSDVHWGQPTANLHANAQASPPREPALVIPIPGNFLPVAFLLRASPRVDAKGLTHAKGG
jgi:hypothetical protein